MPAAYIETTEFDYLHDDGIHYAQIVLILGIYPATVDYYGKNYRRAYACMI